MEDIGLSLLRNIPGIVAWLIGIILAIIMLRRGGAKAEKLLLIGCSLMLANKLISPLMSGLVRWAMYDQSMSRVALSQAIGLASLPLAVLSIASLVCLIWAFWLKFRVMRQEVA